MRRPPLTLGAWQRYDIIRRILPSLEGTRSVLEIGAGTGAMGSRLAERFDYLGVEPDPISFEVANRRIRAHGKGQVLHGDVAAVPAGRKFDLVCAFEVLEHIEDDTAALEAWSARLSEGGWLLLSVPAFERRFSASDRHVGHHRRYERQQLIGLLRSVGVEVADVTTYGFPLGYVLDTIRSLIAKRRPADTSIDQRSAASGRWLQPPDSIGWLAGLLAWPFCLAQRPFGKTDLGVGFVAIGRKW